MNFADGWRNNMTLMDLLEQCRSLDVDKRLAFCFKCQTEEGNILDRRYYVLDSGLDSDDNRVELKYSTDILYQFEDFFEIYKLFEISNTIPTTDIDHIAADNALRSEENKIQPEKILLVYFKDIDFVSITNYFTVEHLMFT